MLFFKIGEDPILISGKKERAIKMEKEIFCPVPAAEKKNNLGKKTTKFRN